MGERTDVTMPLIDALLEHEWKRLIKPFLRKRLSLYLAEIERLTDEGVQQMQNGIELIAAERKRQIEVEGWTPEHDSQHTDGALAVAAACYALCEDEDYEAPPSWPWAPEWWKPKDAVQNLTRAGALIAAEIDRLQGVQPNG